jgi:hypothetical protein
VPNGHSSSAIHLGPTKFTASVDRDEYTSLASGHGVTGTAGSTRRFVHTAPQLWPKRMSIPTKRATFIPMQLLLRRVVKVNRPLATPCFCRRPRRYLACSLPLAYHRAGQGRADDGVSLARRFYLPIGIHSIAQGLCWEGGICSLLVRAISYIMALCYGTKGINGVY